MTRHRGFKLVSTAAIEGKLRNINYTLFVFMFDQSIWVDEH